MTYILKNQLTMGAQTALFENSEIVNDSVLQRIDNIAKGDISRDHVEQAVIEHLDWKKKFPISASLGDTF